jgi:WD40 repeat protein
MHISIRASFVSLTLGLVAAAAEPQPPKVDRHGDLLPQGAVARLGTIQHRMQPGVTKFTPDGKLIVAMSWGKYVSIFDAKTGRLTHTSILPCEPVLQSILFDDAERALLIRKASTVGSERNQFEIWNIKRGKLISTISNVVSDWNLPLVSPDGRHVASLFPDFNPANGIYKSRILIWDSATGREQVNETLDLPIEQQNGVGSGPAVFSADSSCVVSQVSLNGTVFLLCWDVERQQIRWSRALKGQWTTLLAGPKDSLLVRRATDSTVIDLKTGATLDLKQAKADRLSFDVHL